MNNLSKMTATLVLAATTVSAGAWWATPGNTGASNVDAIRANDYAYDRLPPLQTPFLGAAYPMASPYGMAPESLHAAADQQYNACEAQRQQTLELAKRQAQAQKAQRHYAQQLAEQQQRAAEQAAIQQAQAQEAQRQHAEQMAAEQARRAQQYAQQQAQAQEAQRQYAEQMAAEQARRAQQYAQQQAQAQETQHQYSEQMAAQQAQAQEAQRKFAKQLAADRAELARQAPADQQNRSYFSPNTPMESGWVDSSASMMEPFAPEALRVASPFDHFNDPVPCDCGDRSQAYQARRDQNRETLNTRRAEMLDRRDDMRQKMEQRRLAYRPHRSGMRGPFDRPTCEEL